ncbi:MAG: class I SAM-dependent methyltransferase [Burkholderiales bacterium]
MQIARSDANRVCSESEVLAELLDFTSARIVELGCGQAEYARRIARDHPTATFVASEVDRIQHAANLAAGGPPNLRFADFGAEQIPLPAGTIDIVLLFKSLHHVPRERLDDALDEIARVLRPGGLAYVSEPVFAGDLNEIIRVFNDEETVRALAFDAVVRAVDRGALELVRQVFFAQPVAYRDFADFARRHFAVTHSERNLTDAQRAEVERRFNPHLGPEGARFVRPMRVDLLRRA